MIGLNCHDESCSTIERYLVLNLAIALNSSQSMRSPGRRSNTGTGRVGLGKMVKVGAIIISVACICFASIFYSMEPHNRELASDLPIESAVHASSTDADLGRHNSLELSPLDDDATTRSIRGLFTLHHGQASGTQLASPPESLAAGRTVTSTSKESLLLPSKKRSTNDAIPDQVNLLKSTHYGGGISISKAKLSETSEIVPKDDGVEDRAVHRSRNLELVLELASDVESDATPGHTSATDAATDADPVAVSAAEELSLDNGQASVEQPSTVQLDLAPDVEPIVTPTIRLPVQEPLTDGVSSSESSVLQTNDLHESNANGSDEKVEAAVVEGSSKAARKALAKARAAEAAEAKRKQKEARAVALANERAATVAAAVEDRVQGRARSAISSCFEPTCPRPWRDASGERIEAHGGGMLRDWSASSDGLFYWYGEGPKSESGHSSAIRGYVACSLGGPWRALGDMLTAPEVVAGVDSQQEAQATRLRKHESEKRSQKSATSWTPPSAADHLDFPRWSLKAEQMILERPKVIFNAATGKYVMWFHLDATHSAPPAPGAAAAAVSPSPAAELRRGEKSSSALGSNTTADYGDDDDDDEDDKDEDEDTRRSAGQELGAGFGQGVKPSKVKRRKYWIRRAGVAVADHPQGPFLFAHALKPDGEASLDLQLFQEEVEEMNEPRNADTPFNANSLLPSLLAHAANGNNQSSSEFTKNTSLINATSRRSRSDDGLNTTLRAAPRAYLIRSCDNVFVGISPLSDDYLNTTGIISTYRPALEGMAVFRIPNGTYYALLSHMTGWESNPLVSLRAAGSSLADPQWVNMGNPTHEPRSYHAQPTFVVRLQDRRHRPFFALMSDNWVRAGPRGLRDAGYIWLPLIFHSHSVRLQRLTNWTTNRPLKDAKWENASTLHALATSEHATTIPGSAKGGGKGGSGESWSQADDPHSNWCTDGSYLQETPYCCSAECDAYCGASDCLLPRARAFNLSLLSKYGLNESIVRLPLEEALEVAKHYGRASGGRTGMATVVEAVTQGARVECCPEAITRPCESASDTACLLELAPRKRPSSSKANSAAALDWSPKMEKISKKEQEKQEKRAMLRRIDSAFFASSKSAKKKSSSPSTSLSSSSAGSTAVSAVALASAAAAAAAVKAPFPASLPDSSSSSSSSEGGGDVSGDPSEVLVVNAVAVPANSANHTIVANAGGGGGGSWAERQKAAEREQKRMISAAVAKKEKERLSLFKSIDRNTFSAAAKAAANPPTAAAPLKPAPAPRPPKPNIFERLDLTGKKNVQERLETAKSTKGGSASREVQDPGVDGLAAKHGASMLAANSPRPPPHPLWAANRLRRAAEKDDPGVDGLKARAPEAAPPSDGPTKKGKWAKRAADAPPTAPSSPAQPNAPAAAPQKGKWAKGKWAKKGG